MAEWDAAGSDTGLAAQEARGWFLADAPRLVRGLLEERDKWFDKAHELATELEMERGRNAV